MIFIVFVVTSVFLTVSFKTHKNHIKLHCVPQITMNLWAMMDTITVIVEGKIEIPEYKHSDVTVYLSSKTKDYQTKTDAFGNFKFSHIHADYYLIIIQGDTTILKDFITLRPGGIYKSIIDCK